MRVFARFLMTNIFKKGLRSWSRVKTIFVYRKLIRASIKTFRPILKITNKKIMRYVSMVTIVTMVFGLSFWSTDFNSASADVTTIFSDDFDQGASGNQSLANSWYTAGSEEGPGSDARDDSTDDSWTTVEVSGKALLLEGSSGTNPDEGAQRDVSTMGYKTLTVQYSRATSGFESGDELVIKYSLDDGSFTELETVTGNNAHSNSALFTIDNSERKTKLTLKFYVNADNGNDEAGIDDLVVTGEDTPIFYDGFENDWQSEWTTHTDSQNIEDEDDTNIWTDGNSEDLGNAVEMDDGSDATNEIILSLPTTDYENINVRYAREVENLSTGEGLRVGYSVDGTNYVDLETRFDNDDYESVTFALPVTADDNSNFKLRFDLVGNHGNDNAYIDDVVVWGDEIVIPVGSISGYKFNDLNGDGFWDQEGENPEPGLANWAITLSNGDETITDENGYYTFEGLANNSYTVCEEVEEDWSQTYPNSNSDDIADANIYESCNEETDSLGKYGYEVEIDEDQVKEVNFGNIQYGSITIVKETNPSGYEDGFTFTFTDHDDQRLSDSQSYIYEDLIAGNYTVQEVVSDGWTLSNIDCVYDEESVGQETENGKVVSLEAGDDVVCTFTNTKLGSITVWKYADPFGGSFDFELEGPTPGETTIFTDEDGEAYVFENLEPGNYNLSETVPDGWTSDGGSCGEDGDPSNLELSAGGNVTCVFNNTEYGSISGRKFEDLNVNHEDDEDPGLEWDVNLYQIGDEGWSFVTSQETDSETGNYMFDNLLPGTYKVCETLEDDWIQSYPELGSDCEGSYGYEVVVSAGQDVLDQDFGNYQKGSITGYKFEDMDGDGGWGDESVLSEWIIYIDADNDGFLNEGEVWTTTDEGGYYSFVNLEPGDYVIREVSQDGWVQKLPSDGSGYEITLTSGEAEGDNNFGNFKKPAITVYKFNDLDGDGIRDIGEENNEPPLQNWTMALGWVGTRQQPEEPAGPDNQIPIEIVAMSLTGGDGSVRFTVDRPGDYKAFEVQQDGWSVTSPGHIDSFFDITYDLKSIADGDPDFDLLSIGDPDFDLLRSSFFDIFVEISGQNINSDNQEMPLVFLNHLIPTESPTPTPSPSESPTPTPESTPTPTPTPTPSESPTPTPTPENNGGGGGGGGVPGGIIIDGPGSNNGGGNGGGTVAGASTTPTPIPTPSSTPGTSGSTSSGGSSGSSSSSGGEPSSTPSTDSGSSASPTTTPTPSETPAPSESPLPEDNDLFAQFLGTLSGNWWWWLLPLFALIILFLIWRSRRS